MPPPAPPLATALDAPNFQAIGDTLLPVKKDSTNVRFQDARLSSQHENRQERALTPK